MRNLLIVLAMLVSAQAMAAGNYCDDTVIINKDINYFGIKMQMRVQDPAVIEKLTDLIPYGDCYQGVCSARYAYETQEFVINFTVKSFKGYEALGRASKFTAFTTDNGTWLSVQAGDETDSFLFRGCY